MMEIKLIPDLPQKIKKSAQRGDLVVFIGAGMSYELGCSSWNDLAKNLIKKCENTKLNHFEATQLKNMLTESGNAKKIITICNSILSEDDFLDEMKKSLNDDKVSNTNPKLETYRDLYSLNAIFVTTNADRHIDQIFSSKNIIIEDFNYNTEIINRYLYKIHGSITKPKSLIFTVEEYFRIYKDKNFIEFLQKLFQKTILFVGYGLGEFELLEYMFKNIQSNENSYFYLSGYFNFENRICEFEQLYFKHMNIELIPYLKDEIGFKQLSEVIKEWVKKIQLTTTVLQKNFDDIDEALRNPLLNEKKVIQIMQNSKEYREYFFKNAYKYQNLYLWLEPLYEANFFQPTMDNISMVVSFLENLSIQNREEERKKITNILLKIIDKLFFSIIKKKCSNPNCYILVKILFNLPHTKIELKHLDKIHKLLKFDSSLLSENFVEVIIPTIIEYKMQKHLTKSIEIIFDYEIRDDFYEIESLIEGYCLNELLKKYSKSMIELIDVTELKTLQSIIKDILSKDKFAFNYFRIVAIEEHPQNRYSDNYDYQLISFTRDLLEYLDTYKIKSHIEEFLNEENPIFKRLAFHTINKKYDDLKSIFWSWFDKHKDSIKTDFRHEFYKLLQDNSSKFTDEEFDKLIEWIESLDYSKYHIDRDNISQLIETTNAYHKKDWLHSIKDSNKKAKELYDKYNKINPSEIEHPGFDVWFGGVQWIEHKNPIDSLCEKDIDEIVKLIKNFDPSKYKKDIFTINRNSIYALANDLANCVKENPDRYSDGIEKFIDLDLVYKYKLIYGFKSAWQDKISFDWEKVFDFISKILDKKFFELNDDYALLLRGEVANLIEEGTKSDDNAFDKKYLPKAKDILFLLVGYKVDESITIDDLSISTLNSTNGKALHSLINYTTRYAKLNSSKEIKWEDDIKEFFTNELTNRTEYSKSLFYILGHYLQSFIFFDREWVDSNFNKIFPKDKDSDKFWEISISSYFYMNQGVAPFIYNKFKNNGHFEKALQYNFKSNYTKNSIIQHICVMFIRNEDRETLINIIDSKDIKFIIEIIDFITKAYKKNNINKEELKEKVVYLWDKIYETVKNDSDSYKEIISKLCEWFIFVEEIDNNIMKYAKFTIKHNSLIKYSGYSKYSSYSKIFVELERLVQNSNNIKYIGELFLEIPIYKDSYIYNDTKKQIENIVESLYQNDEGEKALKICNSYNQNGIYFLKDLIKKYGGS